MTKQRETPVQLRRAIGAVRRARGHEQDAAYWRSKVGEDSGALGWSMAANHEWARAAMHLLQWGLS